MSRIKVYDQKVLDRLPPFPDAYGLRGGGDLDALFPVRVLQVVNGAGVGVVNHDGTLTGNGSVASPLGVVGQPFGTTYGGPTPRTGWTVVDQSTNGQAITVNPPADAVAGDLLVALIGYLNTGAVNLPTGWSSLAAEVNNGASSYMIAFQRTATGSGDGFVTNTISGGTWGSVCFAIKPGTRGSVAADQISFTKPASNNQAGVTVATITPTHNPSLVVWGIQCPANNIAYGPSWVATASGSAASSGWYVSDPYGHAPISTASILWRLFFSQRGDNSQSPQFTITSTGSQSSGSSSGLLLANFY